MQYFTFTRLYLLFQTYREQQLFLLYLQSNFASSLPPAILKSKLGFTVSRLFWIQGEIIEGNFILLQMDFYLEINVMLNNLLCLPIVHFDTWAYLLGSQTST